MAADSAGQILRFPAQMSIGTIYCRVKNQKRWAKLCEAKGTFVLGSGLEYRFKLHPCYGPGEVLKALRGIDTSVFEEVQILFLVSRADMADSAVTGTKWMQNVLAAEEAAVVAGLKTLARLTFDTEEFNP